MSAVAAKQERKDEDIMASLTQRIEFNPMPVGELAGAANYTEDQPIGLFRIREFMMSFSNTMAL
jgi:hypothetical protein